MNDYHSILKRQVEKYLDAESLESPKIREFLSQIDSTYKHLEDDKIRFEHATKINEDEYDKLNKKLLKQLSDRKIFEQNLVKSILSLSEDEKFVDNIEFNTFELLEILDKFIEIHKKTELQLVEARNIEKNFLANISHEIRTPLNAIIGFSHLLYDTEITEEQRGLIESVKNSSVFLYDLICDVLDISKIESGKFDIRNRTFDLVGLLKTLQQSYELKSETDKLSFEMLIDPEISGLFSSDDTVLNQILHNLIGNAFKFTNEGTVGLKVTKLKEEAGKIWMKFKVYDSGVGIDQEYLNSIFNKFVQLDNRYEAKTKGTGLGLAITKQLVELVGGELEVKSTVNKGSEFSFTFPMNVVESDPLLESNRQSNNDLQLQSLSELNFLIVEDNAMNRKYISKIFDNKGFKYDMAFDGSMAVEKCKETYYDVILMDILMPNKNGFEACIEIRNTFNACKNSIIIALTASALISDKDKALTAGMNEFITKPFTPNQLLNSIYSFFPNLETNIMSNQAPLLHYSSENSIFEINTEKKKEFGDEFFEIMLDTFWEEENIHDISSSKLKIESNEMEEALKLVHKFKPNFAIIGLDNYYEKLNSNYSNLMNNIEDEMSKKEMLLLISSFIENKNQIKEKLASL